MNILVLSQKISDMHVGILKSALPAFCHIDIITGSRLEQNEYIAAPPHEPKSLKSRLHCWWAYYRFVIRWCKSHHEKKYDLIFATSNPPVNGFLGLKLKKLYKTNFVYMNWDLYPQVIETSMQGCIPWIVSKIWHKLNQWIYPRIDRMVTIGKVMGETINTGILKKIPVSIIPMFTDANRLKPVDKNKNPFCISNKLTDKFTILYSGKMGLGHNLEILLEASRFLKNYKDILFLFIGHGQKYGMIEQWIKDNHSENVRIMPLQSEEIFPWSMACGDIGFISQEQKTAKCFMPAKTYDMMACGMPLIVYASGDDDLSNLVHQYNVGVVVTENNPNILAENILRLYNDHNLKNIYSYNARVAAVNEFDILPVTKKYKCVFDDALTSNNK